MRLPRFSIAGLMGLVVVVAVGVAALRFATELWAGILLMLTLGALGAAVLAFHERTGARRAWWRGFALFGWGYVVLALGPWASEWIAPGLPTTIALDGLYARSHPAGEGAPARDLTRLALRDYIVAVNGSPGPSTAVAFSPDGRVVLGAASTNPAPEPFRQVGHCLWTLLVACVGGVVGRTFHATGERTRPIPADDSPGLTRGREPGHDAA
jgi:hypothetical protein